MEEFAETKSVDGRVFGIMTCNFLQVENLVLLDLAKPITSSKNTITAKLPSAINAFLSLEDKMDPVPPSYTYFDALERLMKATYGGLTEESAKCLMVGGN